MIHEVDSGSTSERVEGVRVDRWLWAIRLFKTRAESTKACTAGHVRLNGRIAKPAAPVGVGDRIEARIHDRDRIEGLAAGVAELAPGAAAFTALPESR